MNGTTEEWHEVCGAEMPAQGGWSPKEPEALRAQGQRQLDARDPPQAKRGGGEAVYFRGFARLPQTATRVRYMQAR